MFNGPTPILDLIIDLSQHQSDRIVIYQHSSPHQLARNFIQKHQLPQNIISHLVNTINSSLSKLQQRKLSSTNSQYQNKLVRKKQQFTQINEDTTFDNSSFMASRMFPANVPNASVFQRLSNIPSKQPQQITRLSQKKAKMSRCQSQRVVHRLNNQSLNRKQNHQKKVQRQRRKKQAQSLKQCTYKPQISQVSELLSSSRSKKQVAKRLNEPIISKKAILQKMRNQKIKAQLRQCSFNPILNNISKKIILFKDQNNMARYSDRSHKESQIQAKTPNICQRSRLLASRIGMSFQNRIGYYQKKHKQQIKNLQKQKQHRENIDQTTGKPLFQPVTYSTVGQQRKNGKSISQYLYQKGKKIPKNTKKPQFKAGIISTLIVQGIRKSKSQQIFIRLDSDSDGIISAKKICIDAISVQKLEIIAPVLIEMENFEFALSMKQFCQAIVLLSRSLTPLQKRILFGD